MDKNIKEELFAGEICSWKLVSKKTCGCEIIKSNKGHFFVDFCNECSQNVARKQIEEY